ncbi:MAG: AbrB/MazE/SpoVT family DNA-binding domain-containing protein [Candidatus Aenigmarchaeota archaeon]|nr:AbrB/MazE/SpoVT family DNA-binding domain-containing protein [Candidatus Aenigmarchaeota archaeon]
MPKAIVRAKKIGGSLMVTIPKEIVEEESIRENQLVEIEVKRKRKDFFGALKGIGPFTKEDEFDTHA